MFGLGFAEILVILVVVLVFFGPERMPELARTLGRASWQLRKAVNEFRSEMEFPLEIEREMKHELRELKRMAWEDRLSAAPRAEDANQPEQALTTSVAEETAPPEEEGTSTTEDTVRKGSSETEESPQ